MAVQQAATLLVLAVVSQVALELARTLVTGVNTLVADHAKTLVTGVNTLVADHAKTLVVEPANILLLANATNLCTAMLV